MTCTLIDIGFAVFTSKSHSTVTPVASWYLVTRGTVPARCGLAVNDPALAIPISVSLCTHAPKTVRDIDTRCAIRAVIHRTVRNANIAFIACPTRVTSAVETIPRWHANTVGWTRVGWARRVSKTTYCYMLLSDVKPLLRVGGEIMNLAWIELDVLYTTLERFWCC